MARRLAESGASVLLLEAGKREDKGPLKSLLDVPGGVSVLLSTPELKRYVDWGYKSVPQTSAMDRVIPLTRGKVVGGSSSVNGMIFVRGNRQNFDDWAADGCKGWSYEEVLPAFKRLEDWEDGASDLRGAGGPIKVRRQRDITGAAQSFLDATPERLGVPVIDDYNGASQEGVGVAQLSAADGHRSSTARGYLRTDPLPNLVVVTGVQATRIVIAGSRATGVEVIGTDGDRQTISATREVVVAAGAYDSPKLLMLSGIGPSEHLNQHDIDVVADIPVGENLHDHLFVPVSHQMDSAVRRPTPAYFIRGLAKARMRRTGWASGSQFDLLGFVRSSMATTAPDLQLHVLYWVYPFPNQDGPKAVRPPTKRPGLTVLPTLIYPESRGTIRLASADPSAAPLIDPGYLRSPRDTEVLIEGITMTREVLAGLGDSTGEVVPGSGYVDEAELRRILPNIVHSVYHPVGSCRMGSDERAVVDPELRVRGIDGLRVADASVMPSIVGGNTNAACIMIGERCAELILGGAA
jgi:choline dehydrogenase-like flavoprotein